LFTEFTRARLKSQEDVCFRELDRVVVKGREAAVSIHERYDCDTKPVQTQKHATASRFSEALAHYRGGEFQVAHDLFEACLADAPDDNVAKLYIAHCANLMANPPEQPGAASAFWT
jgi:hypothetical protein